MKTVQSGLREITIKNLIDDKNEIIDKTRKWRVGVILISWMAFIGFDFLWHAGILAAIWTRPNPALLDAEQLFLRIPFGYLAFLVFVVIMYWFSLNIGINDWKNGMLFGVKFGVLLGVANTLGQYSILTVDPIMLIGWAMGYTIEFSIIGGIIGAILFSIN